MREKVYSLNEVAQQTRNPRRRTHNTQRTRLEQGRHIRRDPLSYKFWRGPWANLRVRHSCRNKRDRWVGDVLERLVAFSLVAQAQPDSEDYGRQNRSPEVADVEPS